MQQLQNASDTQLCASEVLDAVFEVLLLVREQNARQDRKKGATLIHIRAMGVLHKRPGMTLSDLADQLALTLSATSRLIDGLVAKGLVARRIPAGNRRTIALQLTQAGTKLHAHARGEARNALALLLQTLTPAQRAALRNSMLDLQHAIASPNEDTDIVGNGTAALAAGGKRVMR
jgi:DNA-binding MarR family transcriptional regulator